MAENPQLLFDKPNLLISTLDNHHALRMEYSVLCSLVVADIQRLMTGDQVTKAQLRLLIKRTIKLGERLEIAYGKYLSVPREAHRMHQDINVFRYFLGKGSKGQSIDEDEESQAVRSWIAALNWLRLSVIRGKRVMDTVAPMLDGMPDYDNFISTMDGIADPIISYLSWLFFLPRLLTNLFILGKHLIPGWWMSDEEKQLAAMHRVQLSFGRRWFEIGNDVVWVLICALNCFFLLGPLAPVGVYLAFAGYVYDIGLAGLRAYQEISRLSETRAVYQAQYDATTDLDERAMLQRVLDQLDRRLLIEEIRVYIGVVNTTMICAAFSLTIPAVALGPIGPLVAAAVIFSVTLATFLALKLIELQKPAENLSAQKTDKGGPISFGFFAPPPPPPAPAEEDEIDFDPLPA